MFEVIYLPAARATRESLSEGERADVDRIVRLIEINPWADDTTKFAVRIGRWMAAVYDDDYWEIVYRVVDDHFVEIVGINRVGS
ncbi:MAG: hypothetical protein HYX51_01725 [Chloroflexi bacterium]|nr:hypothetical protein [Chloroflexota bacterium]